MILPIIHIINYNIINDTVPDELNVTRIVPNHKNGDKSDFTNFRPISLGRIQAEIVVKIIKPTIKIID